MAIKSDSDVFLGPEEEQACILCLLLSLLCLSPLPLWIILKEASRLPGRPNPAQWSSLPLKSHAKDKG